MLAHLRCLDPPVTSLGILSHIGAVASTISPMTALTAKCILDALVSMKILPDDNRMIVPVLLLRWGPSHQTTVRIHEFLGAMFG